MAGQKLLLPYNFTPQDQKALDFVVETFAANAELEVTLFNTYAPLPDIETSGHSITGKLKENLGYLLQKVKEQEKSLMAVADQLREKGLDEERVHYVFKARKKDVAGEIVDQVMKEHYQLLVLSRKPGKITRFFTASVYSKVVAALKNVTVCIVS